MSFHHKSMMPLPEARCELPRIFHRGSFENTPCAQFRVQDMGRQLLVSASSRSGAPPVSLARNLSSGSSAFMRQCIHLDEESDLRGAVSSCSARAKPSVQRAWLLAPSKTLGHLG